VRFTLKTEHSVTFPLYLRVPGWCKGASVKLNGKNLRVNATNGTYIRLEREWNDGDQLILTLPMALWLRVWQVNQNSASVNYGPLTFSLKIKESYKKINSIKTALWDPKWQEGADPEKWPSYEIAPASEWNYGLLINQKNLLNSFKVIRKEWPVDDYPFSADKTPIEIQAKGKQIPSWGIDQYELVDVLPPYPAETKKQAENITLIPMGAARLRISAFPVIK